MKTYQRDPSDLTRPQLIKLVRDIRAALWPRNYLTKDWSSDEIGEVGNLIANAGLAPTDEALSAEEKRFARWSK